MSFSDVQWGTAADWAAAIGTILAFGAAAMGYLSRAG
jgi:hypothetical protein